VTVKAWPATVSEPLRATPEFSATLNGAVPFPTPDPLIVSQSLAELEVHWQPVPVRTVIVAVPPPPAAGNACPESVTEKVHATGIGS
jgi:hypothetical protein